jgi:hypothetical protein
MRKILLLSLLIPVFITAQTIPSANLCGYWNLDGNTLDGSGNNNNGVLQGGAAYCPDRFGAANKAVKLGGFYNSSAVKIPHSPSLILNNELTIACWFKLDDAGGMDAWGDYTNYGIHTFITKDGDRGGFHLILFPQANGMFGYNFGINNTNPGAAVPDFHYADEQNCINTEWNHVALVIDQISITMYINGMQKHRQTYSSNIYFSQANNNRDLIFGRLDMSGWIWYPLNGKLDDIVYYNRALSQAEINSLYNYPIPYAPAGSMITTTINDNVNLGETYEQNGFSLPAQNTAGTFTYSRTNGCDSIWVLNLTVINCVLTPLSQQYIACLNAEVTVGFRAQAGTVFYWYSAAAGGTLLASDSNIYTLIKDNSAVQTVYAEPRIGGVAQPRIAVDIELSNYCGETTPTGCAANGTVLFREDFGGNLPSDPIISITPLNSSQTDYAFNTNASGPVFDNNKYMILKTLTASMGMNGEWWEVFDHTTINDPNTGYCIVINGENKTKTYELNMTDVCSGSKMFFSLWIANILKPAFMGGNGVKPDLEFIITNTAAGDTLCLYRTGNIYENTQLIWKQYGFEINVPNNVADLTFSVYSYGNGGSGNDYAVDDIELRLCAPPVTLSNENIAVCNGASASVTATFINDGTFIEPIEYKWFHSTDNITWTDIADNDNILNLVGTTPSDTGFYRIAVAGAGSINNENCRAMSNSVHIDLLPSNTGTITDTICQGETYSDNGFSLPAQTAAGNFVHTLNLQTINGCDSTVTLNLTVNQTYNTTLNISICEGESYLFNGINYNQTGTYTANEQTAHGCDSTATLNLTVYQPATTRLSAAIEQGEGYSENGFNIPVQTEAGVFADTLHLQTAHNCDSTVILTLTVTKMLKIDVSPVDEICADDANFNIIYDVIAGNALYFSVLFDGKAQQAGFVDILNETVNNRFIEINMPENVVPDNYSATVRFDYGDLHKEYHVPFTVLYSTSIMQQKWNDVIALKNSYYNGGYTFSAYQWYKNGSAIAGKTGSYIYLGDKDFDFVSSYQALVTRESDGATLLTCPLVPVPHADITQFPTVVDAGGSINIYFVSGYTATIYHASGFMVQQRVLAAGQNTIPAPQNRGLYILQLANETSSQVFRLVVR